MYAVSKIGATNLREPKVLIPEEDSPSIVAEEQSWNSAQILNNQLHSNCFLQPNIYNSERNTTVSVWLLCGSRRVWIPKPRSDSPPFWNSITFHSSVALDTSSGPSYNLDQGTKHTPPLPPKLSENKEVTKTDSNRFIDVILLTNQQEDMKHCRMISDCCSVFFSSASPSLLLLSASCRQTVFIIFLYKIACKWQWKWHTGADRSKDRLALGMLYYDGMLLGVIICWTFCLIVCYF